jgi:hypothetical protein
LEREHLDRREADALAAGLLRAVLEEGRRAGLPRNAFEALADRLAALASAPQAHA